MGAPLEATQRGDAFARAAPSTSYPQLRGATRLLRLDKCSRKMGTRTPITIFRDVAVRDVGSKGPRRGPPEAENVETPTRRLIQDAGGLGNIRSRGEM
eukprot:1428251-Pyramimonas_sp.AAC.1